MFLNHSIYNILQVVLAEWDDYYLAKVVEENPLEVVFGFEPVSSEGQFNMTGKSLKWNKNDRQQAMKEYLVCCLPKDLIEMSNTGVVITKKVECIKYLKDEISKYELDR